VWQERALIEKQQAWNDRYAQQKQLEKLEATVRARQEALKFSRHPWTAKQDALLRSATKKYGLAVWRNIHADMEFAELTKQHGIQDMMERWNGMKKTPEEQRLFPKLFRSNSGVVMNPAEVAAHGKIAGEYRKIGEQVEMNGRLASKLERAKLDRRRVEHQVEQQRAELDMLKARVSAAATEAKRKPGARGARGRRQPVKSVAVTDMTAPLTSSILQRGEAAGSPLSASARTWLGKSA
jgi:hypothetical protein